MWFTAVFVALFVAGWLALATVPWLILSIRTKGEAGLAYLPLSWLAGVVAALLVPLLGLTDERGLLLSFVVSLLAPAGLLAARRFSLAALHERRAARAPAHDGRRE